ncbi:rhodanese-like domain-containing protein [Robertmurraya andreesenii]|uniref:Rhodanese-related sulfurtransferase n=1 Tax=Anoxybacillus andreesenii TaxID=1325932 RepID=A0ABT9V0V0_9BACL|nr:rhodanese-like domain-containing protein [Robertmurraya andreesenii]MDQ0154585.1 rhodanese-related sulfurtransferase [Robertmurraya andreesenii]
MDILSYIVIAVLLGVFIMRFIPASGVKQISTSELKNLLSDKSKQFIDVRTPGEYRRNHIREFKNIPLQDIAKKADLLSKEKEVVVICQSGMRSQNAAKMLKRLGFKNIRNVKGGMSAWR